MAKITSFKELSVWQKSHELVLEIYKITKSFPVEEKFGLASQMKRAAVSVAANIAEGFKRKGIKDKINFYNISQSSLSELEYYTILTKDLNYSEGLEKIGLLIEETGKMLNGLISSIRTQP
ncbi:MAG: four helix bundle protein [Candidatus Omnitrophica bacterium]|nr:four helix bundle protein [Candidatus Omnitrophota bacterium]